VPAVQLFQRPQVWIPTGASFPSAPAPVAGTDHTLEPETFTMKALLVPFAVLLTVGGAAFAQQAWTEIEDDDTMVDALSMTVGDLDDMTLYDATGESIGELDDILMDAGTGEMAASLDVGGFLGMGEKDVLIAIDELSASDDGVMTSLTREQLEALPEYED